MYLSRKERTHEEAKEKKKVHSSGHPPLPPKICNAIARPSAAATTTATTTTSTAATTTATTTTYESTSLGRVFYNPLSTHCWIKRLQ